MSELLAVGVSHHTAPVAVRERLALSSARAGELLVELVATPEITEAVALSTCNRTELYLVGPDVDAVETLVLERLAGIAAIAPGDLPVYAERNCDAARHLYRVAAGLDSMVVGEAEVQGQVKRAYELALGAHATGPLTNRLFRAALATGKRVRSETRISAGHASVATVAVDAARAAIGPLQDRRVLIVGAGETAELTARALHVHGVRTMFVANRRRAGAIALAERFGGESGSFDALPEELLRADVVVTSTSSPHTLLGAEEIEAVVAEREGRPLLLVDLAVPRDIDPHCADLPGVTVLDMDALQSSVHHQMSTRREEARRAEAIVEDEIHSFARWLGSLEILPTLTALRRHADDVVERVLAENAARWQSLSDRDSARVEAIARAVANRILHEPTACIRSLDGDERHARLQLLRELFGLDTAEAEAPAPAEPAPVRALPGH